MKRIIAAALSILVGAFGYTIVDQSIDDRVSKLESEVVELRGEVSAYHSENSTEISPTTDIVLAVGTKLTKSSSSLHKFFVLEYANGFYLFVHPNDFNDRVSTTMLLRSNSPYGITTTTKRATTTDPDLPCDPIGKTTTTTKRFTTTDPDNPNGFIGTTTTTRRETTTTSATTTTKPNPKPVRDLFVYLTDSTAVVSSVDTSMSLKYSYDNDYSQISETVQNNKTYITITYKGYTDPSLAGKTINFRTSLPGDYLLNQPITNNVIKRDGTFEFSATYSLDHLYGTEYTINSVEIR